MPETDYYPALSQLEEEFNEHMRDFRSGIETSEDLVFWLQRSAVLTLGSLDDDFLFKLFTDGYAANAVILGQPASKPRRDPRKEDLETESDAWVRGQLEAYKFTPAYRRAYNSLKSAANEYTDDSPDRSSSDSPPALRPAIQELDERQREVLDDLFQEGGFDSSAALTEWTRDVVAATRGNISDDRLRSLAMRRERVLHEALMGKSGFDPRTRHNFLQRVAAFMFLPNFNKAVRDLSQTASEQVDESVGSSNDTVGV